MSQFALTKIPIQSTFKQFLNTKRIFFSRISYNNSRNSISGEKDKVCFSNIYSGANRKNKINSNNSNGNNSSHQNYHNRDSNCCNQIQQQQQKIELLIPQQKERNLWQCVIGTTTNCVSHNHHHHQKIINRKEFHSKNFHLPAECIITNNYYRLSLTSSLFNLPWSKFSNKYYQITFKNLSDLCVNLNRKFLSKSLFSSRLLLRKHLLSSINYRTFKTSASNWSGKNSSLLLTTTTTKTAATTQVKDSNSNNYSDSRSLHQQSEQQQQQQSQNIEQKTNKSGAEIMSNQKEFKRLPSTILPNHYDLKLKPNLNEFTFEGSTTINIQIQKPTNEIVLNAADLKITKARLAMSQGSGDILEPSKILYDSHEQETATLIFDDKHLDAGHGNLYLEFTGELNDKMKGFYRSKYFTQSGEERYAAVTQFEATDARRCFPCWDEPALKATFDITLVVPTDRVALSNMPVKEEQTLENGLRSITFDRTPIMSTYLVAVVVGEYDYVEDKSEDGILVRVYTPVGKKEQGRFALNVATKVLPYYKDYFNIAYPLPKMDLIAIADFSAGAMENWGLVTYRETFVLVDPENTSLMRKQSIALTVGHEIAHQWFGNLVTMEWWTNLWLNEGYASFVEFLCVNHLFPNYDIWTQFVTDMYTRALELDSLRNSHPIEVPVGHPSEIDEIFDEISYNKGASVIRMLHHWIGDDDFRKGMNVYLTKHQYKNTCTEDLWEALGEASNKPVGEVMSTWVKQMGYPVVSVKARQNGTKRILTLSQDKYTADGKPPERTYFWKIPITMSTSKSPKQIHHSFVLDSKETEITLDNVPEDVWVKINPGTVGFYRTRYTPTMLSQFIPSIEDMTLPPLDRLGLLDDLFALVQAGQTSTVEVLKLIDAYRNETNYTVWCSISNALSKLHILLSHTDFLHKFKSYGVRLYGPVAQRLGWDAKSGESHLDTLLRSLVLNKLVSFDCETTIAEAKNRFKNHLNGTVPLPADLRSACYKAVLQEGDETTFEKMLKLYRGTDLHEEKDRISRALGSIKNVEILKKVIDFAMSKEVRAQDSVFVIVAVAINPKGRDLCWQFFKDNSDKLLEQYQGGFLLTRLIKYLTENFATEEKANEIEKFFKEHEFPAAERTVSQSIETISLNSSWLQRDQESIENYLNNL